MTSQESVQTLARLAARLEGSVDQEAVLYAIYLLHRIRFGGFANDEYEGLVIYLPPRLRRETSVA